MMRTLPAPLTLLLVPTIAIAAPAPPTFEHDVRPILKAYCFDCHGDHDKPKGKLDLRLRRFIEKGGSSGPALVAGAPAKSLLFERIRSLEMPPGKKKLTPAEIAVIERWIASGAATVRPEPQSLGTFTDEERGWWAFQPVRRPPVPVTTSGDRISTPVDAFLLARLRDKWLSFAPDADRLTLIRRATFDLHGLPPTPEEIANFLGDQTPDAYERLIDRLLASPRYGERWGRHWLDVAGYADSEGYAAEDAVRKDAFKYRDYVIRAFNGDIPFDRFLVEQLAGDELVKQPFKDLNADEIDRLVATGFLRMAPDGTGSPGIDLAVARNQVMADTLKIVSTTLFGLTVGCAQCHNHRYDPIPQVDYYRLRAVFEPALDGKNWRVPAARQVSLYRDADRAKATQIEVEAVKVEQERLKKLQEYIAATFEKQLAKLPEPLRVPVRQAHDTPPEKRTPEQVKLLQENPSVNVTDGSLYLYDHAAAADLKKRAEQAAAVRATKPVEEFVRALSEIPGQVPTTQLFHRGDPGQPKQAVEPGVLSIIDPTPIPAKSAALPSTGRRLALAQRLTDGKHPLVARVLVNRVWLHHFGRGLVGTPGDFGVLGERPSHPELLDWLADDFVSSGWKMKRLHRLLMNSTAYRQSSVAARFALADFRWPAPNALSSLASVVLARLVDQRAQLLDPDNRLLARHSVRRLEAEAIRDAVLAVSGQLNDKMFGPPVPVMEDEVGQFVLGIENKNGENRPGPIIAMHGEDHRRSVYAQVRRSRPLSVLDTFDAPVMEPNCEARVASTVTPQALLFMNNEFVVGQSDVFAGRVQREAGNDVKAQVIQAWRLAYGAAPTSIELTESLAFLTEQAKHFKPGKNGDPARQALACLCQALLSANRFLYVD
jgi:hypothetical protein